MDEPSQDPTPPAEPTDRHPAAGESPPAFPPEAAAPAPTRPLGQTPPAAPVPVAVLPGMPLGSAPPIRADVPPAAEPVRQRHIRDFLPVVLVTLAAVATFAGGFLPLFSTEQTLDTGSDVRGALRYTQTGWSTSFGLPGEDGASQPSEPLGVALLVAAAILLVALVFVIRWVVTGRASAGARGVTLGGAAFLAGTVLATAMAGIPAPVDSGRVRFETSLQSGMWLLLIAVLAAAAAVVLGYLAPPGRRPGWADPGAAYADTPTPPAGIAITVLPPEEPERG